MRNLILFIWKHHFIFLFLLLELFAFTFLVQSNRYQKASFFNSMNEISGGLYSAVTNITDYFKLKKVNETLVEENAKLQSVSKSAFIKIVDDIIYINDTIHQQQYQFLGAKIVNNTINRRNNYLTLNKGLLHGIVPDMGVICSNGIVGIVNNVSKNYCSVISVLHKNTHISAKIKKNYYFGLLVWNGESPDYATLTDISKHVELSIGDTIVSRGSSTIFPAEILIGTISDFKIEPGENFYTIKVKLSTNFRNISYVYIVKTLLKTEQLELEKALTDD